MRVDFRKKNNVLVQKQKCGISNDVFSCGTAEIQVTVYCAELQVTDCSVCESRTAELRDIVYSLCGSETRDRQVTEYSLCGGGTAGLKVKALVWKRNCETSSRTKFIVWKWNCVTSKPQYFPCAEAELRHFRAPSHTLFCMRNSGNLSLSIFLVRRRNFKPKNIPCVEAELQKFNYVILAVAPTGIVLVCSVLVKHDRISWLVTRIRTSGKHHDRRPQGQSFLKGQYVGDFLTLQEGPRKGFSPVLPRALAGAYWPCHAHCESHVFEPPMVFTLSFNIAVSRVILQHWQWQSVGYGPVKDVKICFRTSNLTWLSKICSAASALPLYLDG